MTDSKIETGCEGPEKHPDHMCRLMEEGRSQEVAAKARYPKFSCANCEAVAEHALDLCRPQPIERG